MAHKHHLVPRYLGGPNNPDNLVELTVVQHAMYHYCNWRLWGNDEDRIAWKCLAGIITCEQAVREANALGGRNCHKNNPDHLKYLNREGNYHDKMWRGTPLERREEIAQKIQRAKGTQITCFCEISGETHNFPSLKSARKFYSFGMTTMRKLSQGVIKTHKGVSVIRD